MTKLRPGWRQLYCGDVYSSKDNLDTNCCQQCYSAWPWPKLWASGPSVARKFAIFSPGADVSHTCRMVIICFLYSKVRLDKLTTVGMNQYVPMYSWCKICVNPEASWSFLLAYLKHPHLMNPQTFLKIRLFSKKSWTVVLLILFWFRNYPRQTPDRRQTPNIQNYTV